MTTEERQEGEIAHRLEVWALREGNSLAILCASEKQLVCLCTSTFYPEERLLHLNTLESICTVKGLAREVLVRSLRAVAWELGRPTVYVYSRPSPSFWLGRQTLNLPGYTNDQLRGYWTSVLEGIGYAAEALGHREVRRPGAAEALAKYAGLVQCIGRLEDDPLSRSVSNQREVVDSHQRPTPNQNPNITEMLTILANSKDLTNGTLIIAEAGAEAGAVEGEVRVKAAPPGSFRGILQHPRQYREYLADIPPTIIAIKGSEIRKREPEKIIRLNRKKRIVEG
ncbi:hypothetical protein NEDG_00367 [Nematocida displodere]|uniref:Uncharacterized protein n=1 Tax=Nematocida displodere TaxID=1805483 RepID=A0A177ELB7_9MICR|nr:hypothetical protein NEDG_00367 [Nematocida displodere]